MLGRAEGGLETGMLWRLYENERSSFDEYCEMGELGFRLMRGLRVWICLMISMMNLYF